MANSLEEQMNIIRAEADRKIAELQAEIDRRAALDPDQRLAEFLHESLCRWNHTDGCSWLYEVHESRVDWGALAHERWLIKARQVRKELADMNDDEIVRVVNAIRGM